MNHCRAGTGLLVIGLIGLLAWAAAAPTARSRGNDELVYSLFGRLGFQAQGIAYDQPVRLQQRDVSELSIPYHLDGPDPARVHVRVSEPSGAVLVDEVRVLPPTITPITLDVRLDNSYWDGQQSGWAHISLHTREEPQELLLHLDRLDATGGGFFLYTDPSIATSKDPLVQDKDIAIVVQTSYGDLRPALFKAPVYAERVNSLAPPWLGGILPELLALLLLLLGVLTVYVTARPPLGPSSKLTD